MGEMEPLDVCGQVLLWCREGHKRGGGKDIISKSQAGQRHPAWPPVSEEGERVNAPAVSTKVQVSFY